MGEGIPINSSMGTRAASSLDIRAYGGEGRDVLAAVDAPFSKLGLMRGVVTSIGYVRMTKVK